MPPRSENFEKAKLLLRSSKVTLTEYRSKKLLSHYGIPIPKGDLAHSVEEAINIAQTLGYPVVLKVSSPQILHKTEARGIALRIPDKAQLVEAYRRIMNNAKAYDPSAEIEGVLVEEMAQEGTEVIIGLLKDPQFGPTIMFGLGGIFVEILKDVSFRVPPLTETDARQMIEEIKGAKILKGFRGKPESDWDAMIDTLMKVSTLSLELREVISELDINPLIVYEQGKGIKALDALVRPA
jgi:acetyltransferase